MHELCESEFTKASTQAKALGIIVKWAPLPVFLPRVGLPMEWLLWITIPRQAGCYFDRTMLYLWLSLHQFQLFYIITRTHRSYQSCHIPRPLKTCWSSEWGETDVLQGKMTQCRCFNSEMNVIVRYKRHKHLPLSPFNPRLVSQSKSLCLWSDRWDSNLNFWSIALTTWTQDTPKMLRK